MHKRDKMLAFRELTNWKENGPQTIKNLLFHFKEQTYRGITTKQKYIYRL